MKFQINLSSVSAVLLLLASAASAATVIPLRGLDADETSGDGWALRIPNLNGETTNGVFYWDSVDVAPKAPFDIGTITYDAAALTSNGVEVISVTPDMVFFNFGDYGHDAAVELEVIGTISNRTEISNVAGAGLTFIDGELAGIDFVADATWIHLMNGFVQHIEPYQGHVAFGNGGFEFDFSENAVQFFIGGTNYIDFIFDLTGDLSTASAGSDPLLPPPSAPGLELGQTPSNLVLNIAFTNPSSGTFLLEGADDLAGPWTSNTVISFTSNPGILAVPVSTNAAGFFRTSLKPLLPSNEE